MEEVPLLIILALQTTVAGPMVVTESVLNFGSSSGGATVGVGAGGTGAVYENSIFMAVSFFLQPAGINSATRSMPEQTIGNLCAGFIYSKNTKISATAHKLLLGQNWLILRIYTCLSIPFK